MSVRTWTWVLRFEILIQRSSFIRDNWPTLSWTPQKKRKLSSNLLFHSIILHLPLSIFFDKSLLKAVGMHHEPKKMKTKIKKFSVLNIFGLLASAKLLCHHLTLLEPIIITTFLQNNESFFLEKNSILTNSMKTALNSNLQAPTLISLSLKLIIWIFWADVIAKISNKDGR